MQKQARVLPPECMVCMGTVTRWRLRVERVTTEASCFEMYRSTLPGDIDHEHIDLNSRHDQETSIKSLFLISDISDASEFRNLFS